MKVTNLMLSLVMLLSLITFAQPTAASTAYQDAENVGNQLLKLRGSIETAISAGDLERIDLSYNSFTNQLTKTERAIGKVSGSSNRAKLNTTYITPSKKTKERVIYEVSQIRLLEAIERSFLDGNKEKGTADLQKLERLKRRAVEIKEAGGYQALPDKITRYLRNFESRVRTAGFVQNLGPQLTNVNVSAAAFANSSNGDQLMLTVLQGLPGTLVVTNLETKQLVDVKKLAGTTTGWSIEQGEAGMFYIGTTPNELLYKYDLNRKQLTKIGKATTRNSTVIWDLDYYASAKALFGVSSNEGKAFRYIEGQGFKDYGTIIAGKKDARSVAYGGNSQLFVGVGSPLELVALDLNTKNRVSMLPAAYKNEKTIQAMKVVDNLLFVKLNPSAKILYFDVNTKKLLGEFPANSFGVSDKSPFEQVVYYGYNNSIYSFNLKTKERNVIVEGRVPGTIVSMNVLRNEEGGYTLAGKLGSNERFFTYDFDNGYFQHDLMTLPPQPIELHHIGPDAKGNIYSSGFLNGSLSIYSPASNKTVTNGTTGQVESSAFISDKLYLGVYPSAKIMEYTPATKQLKELTNLSSYGQDRPSAVVNIPGTNQLYIGTTPRSGYKGGALAVLDTSTKRITVKNQAIPDQSIVSLAYSKSQKRVYGGTSIFGKPNVDPATTNAKLFTVPTGNPNAAPTVLNMPFKNIRFYSALTIANDGMVWGLADEILYAYHPSKGVVFSKKIVNDVSGHSPNGSLVIGKDGYLYGVVEGTMFKMNSNNKKLTYLRSIKNVKQLIQAQDGTIYFHDGVNLWKYSI